MAIPCLNAQDISKSQAKQHFADAEFFFSQEDYKDALAEYMTLYNNGYADVANINYRIGVCYLNISGEKAESIPYLLEATTNTGKSYKEGKFRQIKAPFDVWLYLGNSYRINNMLDEAINAYNIYKEITGSKGEILYAEKQIEACQKAMVYMDSPVDITFTNLGEPINNNNSNFRAVISGNGKTLLYMNELPFYKAIYYSEFVNGAWTEPVNITSNIQSDGDQYVNSLSYDGTVLFLTKEDAFNSDIYVSRYIAGSWQRSLPINGQEINTKYWESHASVSKDGQTLYFASNRNEGFGYMDIYTSQLQSNGQWGKPVNIGNTLNTSLNEDTPFVTENDSMLYFSSQGHENIGGYDILVSTRMESGEWGKPENLGFPVNTTDDDVFYLPWLNGRIGYKAINSEDGLGEEDIYALQTEGDTPLYTLLAELVSGVTPSTDLAAEYTGNDSIADEKSNQIQDYNTDILPVKIKTYKLQTLYFTFDSYTLTNDDKEILVGIKELMDEFPALEIMLVGHTDAIGPEEYNMKLSERRSHEAYKYLEELGVFMQRVKHSGKGETQFAAINSNPNGTDNPEGRKLNRRVEIEITGNDDNLLQFIKTEIPEELKYR